MKKQLFAVFFSFMGLCAQAQMDDFAAMEQHKHQQHLEQADFLRGFLQSRTEQMHNGKLALEFLAQLRTLHGLATSSQRDFAVYIQDFISYTVGNIKMFGGAPELFGQRLEKYQNQAKLIEEKLLSEPSEFWAAYADNLADALYLEVLQELVAINQLELKLDKFTIFISPNSVCRQGQPYKMELGLGAINSDLSYSWYINGKLQEATARGLSSYQFIPEKAGKQKLEVEVRLSNPFTGETISQKKTLLLEVEK